MTIDTGAGFDAMVATAWNSSVCCQTAQSHHACQNAARWLAIDHACKRVTLCTFHKNRWLSRAWVAIANSGDIGCPRCTQRFAAPYHRVSFRPL